MDPTPWLLLVLSVLLMLACGVFVAAEYAFVTVDRATIDRDAEAGDRGAIGTRIALRTLSTQLSGAQLGITITNLIIGFLAEPALGTIIPGPKALSYALALAISTTVTMLIGELVPKNIALALPQATASAPQLP